MVGAASTLVVVMRGRKALFCCGTKAETLTVVAMKAITQRRKERVMACLLGNMCVKVGEKISTEPDTACSVVDDDLTKRT